MTSWERQSAAALRTSIERMTPKAFKLNGCHVPLTGSTDQLNETEERANSELSLMLREECQLRLVADRGQFGAFDPKIGLRVKLGAATYLIVTRSSDEISYTFGLREG